MFTCSFCKVKSYLLSKGHFRYLFPSKASGDKEIFHAPYWRFKGMVCGAGPKGVDSRFVDMSHLAVDNPRFPATLGLRSQALRLKFATSDTNGRFIAPNVDLSETMEIFEFQFRKSLPKPLYHLDHIGENASIIYSPFYLDRKIHDAILNQPVPGPAVGPEDMADLEGAPLKWAIRFIPTLCPACGWDLEGHRDSLTLTCKNCMTAWAPGKNSLKPVKFAYAPMDGENIIHLPFYRIRAKIKGVELESYADLAKVANLPKAPQPKWADIPFYFWGLAFKIRPQIFLRLATSATLTQPSCKLEKGFPKRFHPVNLPVGESVESLKLILAGFIKPRPRYYPILDTISIKPLSYLLVWLPFEIRQHDLVDPVYGFCVNKNALALAGNL